MSYISNRNIAAAALVLWPMLLIAVAVVDRARRLAAVVALVLVLMGTVLMSQHDTSVLALAASALAFGLARFWPRAALAIVAVSWAVACLLVVPLTGWGLKSAELHKAQWLPSSARHRVVLWGYTAERVLERPVLGIGTASTRIIDNRRGVDIETYQGTRYQWRSGPHAHNIYLQVWYELGAVGAVLLCAAGLALVALLKRVPPPAFAYAVAAFTCAAVMGAFSWGFWQAWFMAAFAVSAVATALGTRLTEAEPAHASARGAGHA